LAQPRALYPQVNAVLDEITMGITAGMREAPQTRADPVAEPEVEEPEQDEELGELEARMAALSS